MATFNKFQTFVKDIFQKVHELFGSSAADNLAVYLSNTTPDAANHKIKTDLAEITNQNGYTGPVTLPNQDGTESSGVFTITADSITITASGGTVGPFQYIVLMNDTATDDPLISWWDYGSEVSLADGESLTIKFNNVDSAGKVLDLS